MTQERLIRLVAERRKDGSMLVCSPELPLLHLAITSSDMLRTVVLPVVKEMIERNRGGHVDVRLIDVFGNVEYDDTRVTPAHVIAQMAA